MEHAGARAKQRATSPQRACCGGARTRFPATKSASSSGGLLELAPWECRAGRQAGRRRTSGRSGGGRAGASGPTWRESPLRPGQTVVLHVAPSPACRGSSTRFGRARACAGEEVGHGGRPDLTDSGWRVAQWRRQWRHPARFDSGGGLAGELGISSERCRFLRRDAWGPRALRQDKRHLRIVVAAFRHGRVVRGWPHDEVVIQEGIRLVGPEARGLCPAGDKDASGTLCV